MYYDSDDGFVMSPNLVLFLHPVYMY